MTAGRDQLTMEVPWRREFDREAPATVPAEQPQATHLDAIPREHMLSFLQLAHELRSPLAFVLSALDVVLQGYVANDPELQDQLLSRMRERVDGMLAQVNDFLRLGAVRHKELLREVRPVQLLEVLARLSPEMAIRAKWRSVAIDFELPESLPQVLARQEDMEHLLSNLINNAIKYTNPGGRVTVTIRAEGDSVVGIVKDTGIGIPPEDIPRIFEEFYRGANAREMTVHGTGLGLSIVKRIVDRYGGDVQVESKVGRGTTFGFALPRLSAVDQSATHDVGLEDDCPTGPR